MRPARILALDFPSFVCLLGASTHYSPDQIDLSVYLSNSGGEFLARLFVVVLLILPVLYVVWRRSCQCKIGVAPAAGTPIESVLDIAPLLHTSNDLFSRARRATLEGAQTYLNTIPR
jgi:hypothetical protein